MTHESAAPGSRGALPRVLDLIRDIRVALLTTLDRDGAFHTRPVQTLRVEDEGTLWFFTDVRSDKAEEVRVDTRVSLGYADTAGNRYVAVSGMERCGATRTKLRNSGRSSSAPTTLTDHVISGWAC